MRKVKYRKQKNLNTFQILEEEGGKKEINDWKERKATN